MRSFMKFGVVALALTMGATGAFAQAAMGGGPNTIPNTPMAPNTAMAPAPMGTYTMGRGTFETAEIAARNDWDKLSDEQKIELSNQCRALFSDVANLNQDAISYCREIAVVQFRTPTTNDRQ